MNELTLVEKVKVLGYVMGIILFVTLFIGILTSIGGYGSWGIGIAFIVCVKYTWPLIVEIIDSIIEDIC